MFSLVTAHSAFLVGVNLGLGSSFVNQGTEFFFGVFGDREECSDDTSFRVTLELPNAQQPKALQKMRARYLAFTTSNDVVGRLVLKSCTQRGGEVSGESHRVHWSVLVLECTSKLLLGPFVFLLSTFFTFP